MSGQAKHTPGPWAVRKLVGSDGALADCFVEAPSFHGDAYGSEILGDDEYSRDGNMDRKLADANLTAAGPDLLEALQYARRMMRPDSDMEFVDAAIRKATGAAQ